MSLGHFVHVESDIFRRFQVAFLTAEYRVLFSLLGARVIEVIALAIGHVLVGLLDAREHLFVERLLETGGRLHHRVGVIGLGLEVGQDVFVGLRLVGHPGVIVRDRVAVDLRGLRSLPGGRRFRRLFLSSHLLKNNRRNRRPPGRLRRPRKSTATRSRTITPGWPTRRRPTKTSWPTSRPRPITPTR